MRINPFRHWIARTLVGIATAGVISGVAGWLYLRHLKAEQAAFEAAADAITAEADAAGDPGEDERTHEQLARHAAWAAEAKVIRAGFDAMARSGDIVAVDYIDKELWIHPAVWAVMERPAKERLVIQLRDYFDLMIEPGYVVIRSTKGGARLAECGASGPVIKG